MNLTIWFEAVTGAVLAALLRMDRRAKGPGRALRRWHLIRRSRPSNIWLPSRLEIPMVLDDNGLPILDQFSEEGFVDCIFKISDLKNDHGFYHFDLFASYDGVKVGFSVKLVDSVGPGFDADMKLIESHVYHQGVSFRSIGQASDDLIAALAKLYGRDPGTHRMVSEETFTMIALQQEDTDLKSHSVKMKLFGKDSDPLVEDDYYESFFNVDLPGGFVSWNEKDPDYRDPLIRALSAV